MDTINDFLKWIPVHEYSPAYEKLMLKEDVEKAMKDYCENLIDFISENAKINYRVSQSKEFGGIFPPEVDKEHIF